MHLHKTIGLQVFREDRRDWHKVKFSLKTESKPQAPQNAARVIFYKTLPIA